MANWALVIGCDRYPAPTPSLKGAVRDALRMREWLLAADGGNVPTQNLSFLASPSPDGAAIPDRTAVRQAKRDDVISSIRELMQRSRGDTGRLFFYFAGHGLTARINFSDEQAIACADFTADLTMKAIRLRAIREQFLASSLTPQFFFVDACRNLPFDGEVNFSGMDRPAAPDYSHGFPDQLQCCAAQPGGKAYQTGGSGEELGAFTGALLRGLAGEGAAKRFDPAEEVYVVRFDQLHAATEKTVQEVVDQAVKDRMLSDPSLVQLPKKLVEGSSENPVLATFTADSFADVTLEVTLEPPEACTNTWLEVVGPYDSTDCTPPLSAPLVLSLQPRAYSLRPRSAVFVHRPPGVPVELYEPRPITIKLEPLAPEPDGRVPEAVIGSNEPFREPGGRARPGRLVVDVKDPSITVEAVDEAGRAVSAPGKLELSPAGIYRVYGRTPEGTGPERLVEVLPGADSQIVIPSSAPRLPFGPSEPESKPPNSADFESDFAVDFEYDFGEDFERESGEQKPAGGGLKRLAYAAAGAGIVGIAAVWLLSRDLRGVGVKDWTRHLDAIIEPVLVEDGSTALHVVVADGRGERGNGSVCLAQFADKAVEILPITATDRLRVAGLRGDPGPGLLRIQIPGEPDMRFDVAVHLGPRHPTVVVVELDSNGELGVYEHILTETEPDPDSLRLEGMAQRFARQGQWQHALALLRGRQLSLTAEALYASLLLATSADPDEVVEVASTLLARDELFVDAQVLAALASARKGAPQENVGVVARTALGLGLPVLDFCLTAALDIGRDDADETVLATIAGYRSPGQVVTTLAVPQANVETPASS